jgi:3-oxoacyl-[acyl-carrier-protein] synthase II
MGVVVTGVGMVSALGRDTEACLAALRAGENPCRLHDFERLDGSTARAPAYIAPEVDPAGLIEPRKLRRMFRLARMAAVAARLALRDAGLDPAGLEPSRLGVSFGTSFGALDVTQKFMDSWLERGEEHASPLQFMNSVHGILASQIALDINATGINLTNAQRDVCFETALDTAVSLLETRRADVLIVGAADEITPLLHEVGSRAHLMVLDPDVRGVDPAGARHGYVPGEGAGVLVLERDDTPRRPLARLLATAVGRHDQGGDDLAARLAAHGPELWTGNADGSLAYAALGAPAAVSYHGNFGTFPSAGALQCVVNVLMLAGREGFAPLAGGKPLPPPEPPRVILHDARSTSGNHAAYVLARA